MRRIFLLLSLLVLFFTLFDRCVVAGQEARDPLLENSSQGGSVALIGSIQEEIKERNCVRRKWEQLCNGLKALKEKISDNGGKERVDVAEDVLNFIGISNDEVGVELKALLSVESSWWRSFLRWKTADSALRKGMYWLYMTEGRIGTAKKKPWNTIEPRHFPQGEAITLDDERARRETLFVDGLRDGTEAGVFTTLHVGLLALTVYHAAEYFVPTYRCGYRLDDNLTFWDFLTNIKESDKLSIAGIMHTSVGNRAAVGLLFSFPFIVGVAKGGWRSWRGIIKSGSHTERARNLQAPISIWNKWFSFLPFHPYPGQIEKIVNELLWNGNLNEKEKEEIFKAIERVVETGRYARVLGLRSLARIAYGSNIKDLKFLYERGKITAEAVRQSLSLKERAIELLRQTSEITEEAKLKFNLRSFFQQCLLKLREDEQTGRTEEEEIGRLTAFWGSFQQRWSDLRALQQVGCLASARACFQQWLSKLREDEKIGWFSVLYARYQLWSLGVCQGKGESCAWMVYKGGKLYGQIAFLKLLMDNLLQALRCPEPGGFDISGPTNKAGKNSQSCFDAYVQNFGKFPGQDISAITDHMGNFFFSNCSVSIDLSDKKLEGGIIVQLVKSFVENQPYVKLTDLSIAGNLLYTPQDLTELLSLATDLRSLDISSNQINVLPQSSKESTKALLYGLAGLTDLEELSLGGTNDLQTEPSWVQVAFENLTKLKKLDISQSGHDAVDFIANAHLFTNLRSLNLSKTALGSTNTNMTVMAQNMPFFSQLESFDASNNWVGADDVDGTNKFLASLSACQKLRFLSFANCQIARLSDKQTMVVIGTLGRLIELEDLNLSENNFGTGISHFPDALTRLKNLRTFSFLPQANCVSASDIEKMNEALKQTEVSEPIPPVYNTAEELRRFFQPFSESTLVIDLSQHLSRCLDTAAFNEEIVRFTQLQGLNISRNYLGGDAIAAIAPSIAQATSLRSLDASYNGYGLGDSSRGAEAMAETLEGLVLLEHLDLTYNGIGNSNSPNRSIEMQTTAQALGNLTGLKSLYIGFNGFGGNPDLEEARKTAQVAAQSFMRLTDLTDLRLNHNGLGGSSEILKIYAGSFSHLVNLVNFECERCRLGLDGPEGTIALADSFRSFVRLERLLLGKNNFGTGGSSGPGAILDTVKVLSDSGLKTLDISGMVNLVLPPENFSPLRTYYDEQLKKACLQGLCFGEEEKVSGDAIESQLPAYLRLLTQQNDISYRFGESENRWGEASSLKGQTILFIAIPPPIGGERYGHRADTMRLWPMDDAEEGFSVREKPSLEEQDWVVGDDQELALVSGKATADQPQPLRLQDDGVSSSSSRLELPFWVPVVRSTYQSIKDSGSWMVRAIGSRLDSMADRVTNKIAAYASEVVESTPHYHTPGLWVYDEEGEIIGTTESFGMRTLDDGVDLDRQGGLSGRLAGHLEGQSVCLIPSSGIGGLASNAPVPLISGGY